MRLARSENVRTRKRSAPGLLATEDGYFSDCNWSFILVQNHDAGIPNLFGMECQSLVTHGHDIGNLRFSDKHSLNGSGERYSSDHAGGKLDF